MLDLLHYNIHCLDIQIGRLQITTIKCDQINKYSEIYQLIKLFKLGRQALAPCTNPRDKGCWACSMNYLLRKAVPYWNSTCRKG